MLGGEIWQQMLSRSIILTEQMRQSSGTVEFAEILDGLRTGNGAKWGKKNILIWSIPEFLHLLDQIQQPPSTAVITAFKK